MPRKEKKLHFIYKTTNLLTGRYYIGMHSTDDLEDGYLGSGKRLRYSIRKYGEQNHQREILEFIDTREELKFREKEIVSLDEIAKENCMNLVVGGEGGFSSEQQRENAKKSNERQKELSKNPKWVKKRSKKMTESLNKQYEKGDREKVYFYDWNGKKRSEESKKKMSLSKKGTGVGKNNSQFGTCWITKGGVNKKIKKDDLSQFENEGWIRGMKVK
jgi:hypothetical protein|tara:strand:+ start:17898 stop:18545 length:648 start_codon:yes stop_codon:yes gene_type:complete